MEIIFFRLIDFFYPEKYSSSRFILKVHRKLNSTRVSISFVIAISSLDDIILKNFPSDFQDRGSNQDLKKKKIQQLVPVSFKILCNQTIPKLFSQKRQTVNRACTITDGSTVLSSLQLFLHRTQLHSAHKKHKQRYRGDNSPSTTTTTVNERSNMQPPSSARLKSTTKMRTFSRMKILLLLTRRTRFFFRVEHLFGLLEILQMEEVVAPPRTREPGMLARSPYVRERRIHPTDTLQNALQR